MIKNILLDCDGVLYPLEELKTKDIVDAMKQVYRNDVGLTPDEQRYVSEKTIAENHLGMFNYINAICRFKHYDFDKFCENMANIIDYGSIKHNEQMWQRLKELSQTYHIGVLTNNSRAHLSKVFKRVFNRDITEVEGNGIKAYDIKFTEHNGCFFPKQSEKGLSLFLQKLNMKPEETVLFDDTPVNIEKAENTGMHAVLITPRNSLIKQLNIMLSEKTFIWKNKSYE